jgi:DNA-binding HxlR family transcriptional regulator
MDKNAEGLEIHRVAVDAAAHHVGSGWSLTLLRSLDDDQPRAATVSLSGPLG